MQEEGETQMVAEINIIKVETLCYYNMIVIEAIKMVFQMIISSCPGNMVIIALYNATTVINGNIYIIIAIKLLLIVYVAEAADVVEVHILAEDMALDCYRSVLCFQHVNGMIPSPLTLLDTCLTPSL